MDNLVPDGSSTPAKIKKPRRSEEYLIILCMLGRDKTLTALLTIRIDRKFPVQLMILHFLFHLSFFQPSLAKTFNTFFFFHIVFWHLVLLFSFFFALEVDFILRKTITLQITKYMQKNNILLLNDQ